MKFTVNTYFNDGTGEFICEKFLMNDEVVSEECFDEAFEEFVDGNEDYIEEEQECCECDEGQDENEEQCDCPICTLERYVDELVDITGGCPGCIRESLVEFMNDIVDHIVIEDIEDDIEKGKSQLN
jgi:hypothetical protein